MGCWWPIKTKKFMDPLLWRLQRVDFCCWQFRWGAHLIVGKIIKTYHWPRIDAKLCPIGTGKQERCRNYEFGPCMLKIRAEEPEKKLGHISGNCYQVKKQRPQRSYAVADHKYWSRQPFHKKNCFGVRATYLQILLSK